MPQPKSQSIAFLIIIAAAVLGGGNPAFSKLGLREIPPLTFIFLRFAVGTLILLPWLGRGKGKRPTDFLPLILVTLLSTANIILFTYGVKLTTATISQAIYAVVPIFAAILSAIIIREAVTRKKIAGIITGLAGTTLIVFLPLINGAQTGGDLPGNIMILAGAISFSAYTVLSKKLQRSFTPATITLAFMGTTAAVSFWFALTETISNSGMWLSFSSAAWLGVGYVALLGTASYYLLFQMAIKSGTPVIASMIMYLQPAAAYGWAALLLGERATLTLVIGAILTLIGAWWTTHANQR